MLKEANSNCLGLASFLVAFLVTLLTALVAGGDQASLDPKTCSF